RLARAARLHNRVISPAHIVKNFLLLLAHLLFSYFIHCLLRTNAQVDAVELGKRLAYLSIGKEVEAAFRRDFRIVCRNRSNTGKRAEYAAIKLERERSQQSRTVEIGGERRQPFGLGDGDIVSSLGQIQFLNFDLPVVTFSERDRLLQSKYRRSLRLRKSSLGHANDQRKKQQRQQNCLEPARTAWPFRTFNLLDQPRYHRACTEELAAGGVHFHQQLPAGGVDKRNVEQVDNLL